MKKINTIIVASFAALLALSSCQKSPVKETTDGEVLKININVADIGGSPGTRAAKTSWVEGDKLNIFLDDWNLNGEGQSAPDLVLTYDGSTWKGGSLAPGRALKANGKFLVFYEGYNDLSKYQVGFPSAGKGAFSLPGGDGYDKIDNVYCSSSHLILYNSGVAYSFSGNTLSASINKWFFSKSLKLLMRNDDGNMTGAADEYILQLHNTTQNKYAVTSGIFYIGPYEEYIGSSKANDLGKVLGVREPEGIAFYYSVFEAAPADNIKMTLQKGTSKRSYTVTGKTVVLDGTKIMNIALNYSRFTAE